MNLKNYMIFAAIAVGLAACASSGGPALFRHDLGTATAPDAYDRTLRVLHQYHYDVARQEDPPNLLIETHWRPRPPFDDERDAGVSEAESRVTVTGRERIESELGQLYTLRMVVENRVLLQDSLDWTETLNTSMFRDYASEMAKRLEDELRIIGVRRFSPSGASLD